jgi:hypothetical protein
MDINTLFDCKNINNSSKQLYINNLIKLNDNKPIKNLNFLKKYDIINKKLEDYKPNTRRTFIISIVSLLKCINDNKNKNILKHYYELMMDYNNQLKNQNDKTENEKSNWLSQDEIKTIYDNLKNDINNINSKNLLIDDYNKILNYVLLSLYLLNPPRRNKDYQYMKIIKIYKKDLPNDINYLDLTNNKFIFNNYKTNKTYKQQIFDINDDLMNIINLYLKYHPNKKELKDKKITYFIVDFNGLPFKHVNDITKRLNKIFGKNIGVSMLRKIYLTEKYKDTNDEMKQDAEAMGTSTNTIENNYLKND